MVRNLAKLALFFSVTFIITFAVVMCLRFLTLRVDWAKNLPVQPETTLTLIITAAHWALSLTLFSSILITLNYVVRKKYFPLISMVCVMLLSFGFSFGISFLLEQWKSVPYAQAAGVQLGERGLMLSNSLDRNVTTVILLEGTANPYGPRVTAIPGQPLTFHETTSANITLPPVPFGGNIPWFLESLSIDIRLNAAMFRQKFNEGFFSYLFYTGSIIFLLCSLGYAVKFSGWPLINLFLAIVVFRGVFALGAFFNSPEMQEIIGLFLNNMVPAILALPLAFILFGILVNTYSLLVFVVKRRYDDGN